MVAGTERHWWIYTWDFFQFFIMKICKHIAKLRELCNKHPYVHLLDSTIKHFTILDVSHIHPSTHLCGNFLN